MKYRNQKEWNKKRAEKTAETREQRALSSEPTCCCDNRVSAVPYKEFAVFGLKINLHVKRRRSVWDAKGTPGVLWLQGGLSSAVGADRSDRSGSNSSIIEKWNLWKLRLKCRLRDTFSQLGSSTAQRLNDSTARRLGHFPSSSNDD